jgi:hypothetical protein
MPTEVLALTFSVAARDQLKTYIQGRDGASAAFFTQQLPQAFKKTAPTLKDYKVTLKEVLEECEIGIEQLVQEQLVGSWQELQDMGITLDQIMAFAVSDPAQRQRCNPSLLARLFESSFVQALRAPPFSFNVELYLNRYAPFLDPEDLKAVSIPIAKLVQLVCERKLIMSKQTAIAVFSRGSPKQWAELKVGMREFRLLGLGNTDDEVAVCLGWTQRKKPL